MKLFYKKDYEELLEENKKIKTELASVEISKGNIAGDYANLISKHNILENYTDKLQEENKKLRNIKNEALQTLTETQEELNKKIKSLQGALGGKTKQINKLTKQVDELNLKLKEAMSDKYLVKKIPSGKTPKTQKIKINNKIKPVVQKYMKELENERTN